MSEQASSWRRVGAWDGIAIPGRSGATDREPGVIVMPQHNLSAAFVIGHHGDDAALEKHFASAYGIEPPETPRVVSGNGLDLVWSGPSQWLVLSRNPRMPSELAVALKGAAVSDQGDARAILRLEGARVRDALAKGCPIDLHPKAFRRGDTALTVIGGIGVQLWQAESEDALHVAIFRSMAGSFWSWFLPSAQEFGVEVRAPD